MTTPAQHDFSYEDLSELTEVQKARIAWLLRIPDDEPIFTLRGQDLLSPGAVRLWAREAMQHEVTTEKVEDALRVAREMEEFGPRKIPD